MRDNRKNSGIDKKQVEETLSQGEQLFRLKLEKSLSPAPKVENLELAEIIDIQAIQPLVDDFYKLTKIPIGLNDLKGNVLVGAGWQDICTRFHRIHPETCKHCVESNTNLSRGVSPGEFKLYRCRNNMWDIVTPIMVSGRHVGYVFAGQFFFEDETLDYELFRSQARKYGFDEEEYIAALDKVPRLSREAVDTSMAFFMTFAGMISQLSYSNIKLSRALAERDSLVNALEESEERFRSVLENSLDVAYRRNLQTGGYDYMSPVVEKITGFSAREISEMNISESLDLIHPEDRSIVTRGLVQAFDTGFGTLEYRLKHKDGKYLWLADHFSIIKDQNGKPLFSGGIVRDITESKKAEDALIKAHDDLEKLVEERTIQLESAYKSLKENEKSLSEAQKMAHVGNWDWDLLTGKVYLSDEVYNIFRLTPRESEASYTEFLRYVHPDDREYVDNTIKKSLSGDRCGIDHRIILDNGEERTVYTEREVIFDENNVPVRVRGIIQDITERKKAEEALEKIREIHIKEIHHRIKNNLQVISSLLSLEAEKFSDEKMLESFRESQNRVASMALIHEELYRGNEVDTLDFAAYLQKLTADLFDSYNIKNSEISLKLDLEKIPLDMDIAIPLGIIVNELVSNSLKHAFPDGKAGEIHISFCKKEIFASKYENFNPCLSWMEKDGLNYILTVEDNGTGIPEEIEFHNADSLGLQLVNLLIEQIDGYVDLNRNNGTRFSIFFRNTEA
jgi:PAS domain S-box-containing protein